MPGLDVSFVVANYNSGLFLDDAVASALAQRDARIEVIIVDDHSQDGSTDLARGWAQREPRVRFLRGTRNLGPGGARNLGMAAARGEWIAVLDSDDFVHPDRSAWLLAAARGSAADLIADDLVLFDDAGEDSPRPFLGQRWLRDERCIDLGDYLLASRMYGRHPNLGFLKPMFRRDFIEKNALRYDERLRVAEDDALIIACLRAGGNYRLVPRLGYFYRKHGSSITHRLATGHADAMKQASDELLASSSAWDRRSAGAMRQRAHATDRAWAYEHMLHELRGRRVASALRYAAREPGALPLFRMAVSERAKRLWENARKKRRPPTLVDRRLCAVVVSRQRLSGATSGSSAYVLAIARAMGRQGYAVHLVQPSPGLFGRTPAFRCGADMAFLASHRVRGAWHAGGWFIARSPGVAMAAALGVITRLAARLGAGRLLPERKAPYSVAAPWCEDDFLFLAACAGLKPRLIIADYAFQNEALPYLLCPQAPTATLMHDLFSSRSGQFGAGGDSVATVSFEAELAKLAKADAIIAIQADEAQVIRQALPGKQVLVAAMPADVVALPAPGADDAMLFVGSNNAPNVHGLRWFLDEVWPQVIAARPAMRLEIAGSVRDAFAHLPQQVRALGVVPDLGPVYDRAGIVISPLRQGSGLKIKLVEALARGKACVVTPITLQGLQSDLIEGAVLVAQDSAAFAGDIILLASSRELRQAVAIKALDAASRIFSPATAMAEFRQWMETSVPFANPELQKELV